MSWRRFWFERSMEASRLGWLRLVFFGLLGFDLLVLMVPHAPRYGAGGLNVPHFDALALPVDPGLQVLLYLVSAFLAFRVALGIAARSSLYLLTLTYSLAYFTSLHDGYQHHYLICWLLLISWAVPFHRAPGVDAGRVEGRLKGWGLSLLYAQIAIVYLFTAVTKVDTWWLNGWALEQQVQRPWVREMLESTELVDGYAAVATIVCLWQFSVAASFIFPALRKWACVTGPLFHAMVEVIDLDIGWFSFYMIGLYYLLLFPDDWYEKLAFRLPVLELGRERRPIARVVAAAGVGVLFLFGSALPWAPWLAAAGVVLVLLGGSSARAVGLQLVAALLIVAVPRLSGSAFDHYRFLAGDAHRRGEVEVAIQAYRQAIALKPGPDSRHYNLGRLLLEQGRVDEARAVLLEGQRVEPGDRRYTAALELAREPPTSEGD